MSSETQEQRRRRRLAMEVKVFRPGDEEAAADYDALYWDRIPVDERAAFTWELSAQAFQLANPRESIDGAEPRSPRSIARVFRR